MNWHQYLASFFAGMFLANAVPHFVQGISGNRFPTPFSRPPGKGLSSPTANVVWALVNIVVGYLLFKTGKVDGEDHLILVTFLAGVAAISLILSVNFSRKHA